MMMFPDVPFVISIDSMMLTPLRSSSPNVLEKFAMADFLMRGPNTGKRRRIRSITCRPLSVR